MNDNDAYKTHREAVSLLGKKEYTLQKMQEYGFWPKGLPTPYERQKNETEKDYEKRQALTAKYEKLAAQIAELYKEESAISGKLRQLQKLYNQTYDTERIRREVAREIMLESVARRAERKKQKEMEHAQASEAWKQHKAENIVFIGKGYSSGLNDKHTQEAKLAALGLPIVNDDKQLAAMLGIEYKELRFLAFHRDVVTEDHYVRFTIPKRSGGERAIAAPKLLMKRAQRAILEKILQKIEVSDAAHGFVKGRSVMTGAAAHPAHPALLLNIDLENFFPTITFERVRGMFKSFGYSGYVASLLAMLCTYCERVPMEVKGGVRYVKASGRVLPQGSPASPMITNVLCRRLDKKLCGLADEFGFAYSRYADDMSFSFPAEPGGDGLKGVVDAIQRAVFHEGFRLNKKKTHYIRGNGRQSVTGIVINNERPGVPKAWVKRLRAALFNAQRAQAKGEALPLGKIYEISGMASWLASVNREKYHALIQQARGLSPHRPHQ